MARAARDAARPVRTPARPIGSKKKRWYRRIPTGVIYTVIGGVLTVLILPAVTRQWDDRQKAHELKVALVAEMAATTARAIGESVTQLTTNQSELPIQGRWSTDSLRIEAKLNSYFSPAIVRRWQTHRTRVAALIRAAGAVSPVPHDLDSWEYVAVYDGVESIAGLTDDETKDLVSVLTEDHDDRQTSIEVAILFFAGLSDFLIDFENKVASAVLRAEPEGFSTTRRDLIRDITGI